MDIINEKGVLYIESRIEAVEKETDTKGLWITVGLRPFYYNKVVWIGTLKFVFGSWDKSGGLYAMIEVSCGGIAASKPEINGKVTISKLIQKYKEKLVRYKYDCGEQVVEKFKSNFTIQLWQTKLWAL